MNYKDDPLSLSEREYRFSTNTKIDKQSLSGRSGVRGIPLTSDTEGLAEEFSSLNFQGAIRYSPSQGQSAIQQSDKGRSS